MITNKELQNILDQVNGIFKSHENRISQIENELKKLKEEKPETKRKPGRPKATDNG